MKFEEEVDVMIFVTQPFIPKKEEYQEKISSIWENKWLTNNGPLAKQLEVNLQNYLDVQSIHFVTNGTIALQLAIKALELKGEVITTPFSFVATTTAIIWENCTPVYVDIRSDTLCIDAEKIELAITDKTSAILATHVYGIPCDVEKIERIAKKYNLKVIYDAAHAFGVNYKDKSVLEYGDISTLSFHATKLYHTVEGGGIVNNAGPEIGKKIDLLRNFGIEGDNCFIPGINAKNSEFHAAMGLCNLPYVAEIIENRKNITTYYDNFLLGVVERPDIPKDTKYNYAYYPILLKDEEQLLKVQRALTEQKIQSRRYFYPSLNNLTYLSEIQECVVSENISSRVLCLPLYYGLEIKVVEKITIIIKEAL